MAAINSHGIARKGPSRPRTELPEKLAVSGREIAMPGMKPTPAPRIAPTRPITRAYAAAIRRRVRGAAPTADNVARSGRASESARNVAVSVPPSISTPPSAPSTRRMISASAGRW